MEGAWLMSRIFIQRGDITQCTTDAIVNAAAIIYLSFLVTVKIPNGYPFCLKQEYTHGVLQVPA